jgi:hypothetical protein
MDYKTFLSKALNQQIILSNKERRVFTLDKDVTHVYKTKKFTDFMLSYFEIYGNDQYTLRKEISENERNTIFYYLFINNYLTVFDDYSGFYLAYPSSKLSNKLCDNN